MPVSVECRDLTVSTDGTVLLPETTFTAAGPGLVALTGVNGAGNTTWRI